MPASTEKIKPIESTITTQIEQKVRDAFGEYPIATQRGIVQIIEQQRKNLERLRKNPNDMVYKVAVETGNAYAPSATSIEIPKRELSPNEAQEHQAFLNSLEPYKHSNTYGIPFEGLPNTRFYLSLQDSPDVIPVMTELTQRLIELHKNGSIPFFQYKFDSFDEKMLLRFDPSYRDKGASPILYVSDKDIELVGRLLDDLSEQHPNAFLAQKAPFKYSLHNEESDKWHISMEANDLGNTGTPEQGMKKAVSQFLGGLDLTNKWTPIQSLDVELMRKSWEQATASVHRDPMRPWITTDRPTPQPL